MTQVQMSLEVGSNSKISIVKTINLSYYNKQGFTLIEVIIVLVIVAVMSGVVVLSVSAPSSQAFISESLKIASTLEVIADESVYSNSVISCLVKEQGFDCMSYKDGEWKELDVKKLISWGWPSAIKITKVMVGGQPLAENQNIKFYPNGQLQQMSFQVSNSVRSSWIDGNTDGDFNLSN